MTKRINFCYYRLLDVCDVYQPQTIATKSFIANGAYTVYGANGAIGKYDKYNHVESEIVMACRGASCGALNVTEKHSWINGNAMVIHPNGKIDINIKYLFYILQGIDKSKLISGTAQPQITRTNMKDFQIPIFPKEEQQCIVTRIEELFSELDKGVETLQTIKQQLAVYRQAVLKEAFEGCKTVKASYVCEHITDGDHMPPPKSDQGIPFIMISNIEGNRINWESTSHVGLVYYQSIGEKRTPQKGDVLYTVTGSYGIPVKVDFEKEFCFQRHIALLRPNKRIIQSFLYYALQSHDVYLQATNRATGTAQKTVGLGVLRDIDIPFFSDLQKQQKVVFLIESRLSVCDSIEQTVDAALAQADAMRQSILKQAFEGGFTE